MVKSNGKAMLVVFHTDQHLTSSGFAIKYYAMRKCQSPVCLCLSLCLSQPRPLCLFGMVREHAKSPSSKIVVSCCPCDPEARGNEQTDELSSNIKRGVVIFLHTSQPMGMKFGVVLSQLTVSRHNFRVRFH